MKKKKKLNKFKKKIKNKKKKKEQKIISYQKDLDVVGRLSTNRRPKLL
jgi:hypothetical protein